LFSIVVDPTRKTSQVIAPFAIFGGLITICALDVGGESPEMTAQYIFVGITPNNLYFMMHFIMVIVGTLVLVSTPRLKTHSFFKKKQI
jgi:hypothetical protein